MKVMVEDLYVGFVPLGFQHLLVIPRQHLWENSSPVIILVGTKLSSTLGNSGPVWDISQDLIWVLSVYFGFPISGTDHQSSAACLLSQAFG